MTSDVTLTSTLTNATQTAQQSATLSADLSQFLTLLTTQLQNQDPLSPMDSTEFTNQLVQFSQVEQQINTNQKLDDMLQLQLASMSNVGINYVGLDISYLSAEASYDGEAPVTINYSLSEDATIAKLYVSNEEGEVVYSADVPTTAGRSEVTWDGELDNGEYAEAGTYTIKIDALNSDDENIDVSTAVSGRVRGIETQDGVIYLLVGDRAVPISNVLQAREPETADTTADTGTDGETTDGGQDA